MLPETIGRGSASSGLPRLQRDRPHHRPHRVGTLRRLRSTLCRRAGSRRAGIVRPPQPLLLELEPSEADLERSSTRWPPSRRRLGVRRTRSDGCTSSSTPAKNAEQMREAGGASETRASLPSGTSSSPRATSSSSSSTTASARISPPGFPGLADELPLLVQPPSGAIARSTQRRSACSTRRADRATSCSAPTTCSRRRGSTPASSRPPRHPRSCPRYGASISTPDVSPDRSGCGHLPAQQTALPRWEAANAEHRLRPSPAGGREDWTNSSAALPGHVGRAIRAMADELVSTLPSLGTAAQGGTAAFPGSRPTSSAPGRSSREHQEWASGEAAEGAMLLDALSAIADNHIFRGAAASSPLKRATRYGSWKP